MDLSGINKKIGKKIKEFREFKEVSQATLSERTSINRSTISQIEAGNQQITVGMIYILADKLNTDINTFLPTLSQLKEEQSGIIGLLQKELEEDNIGEKSKSGILQLISKKPDNDK